MEMDKITNQSILGTEKKFMAWGVITEIETKLNFASKKDGSKWVGSTGTITLRVNGSNQKIRMMGCTVDDGSLTYNNVKVCQLDSNGKVMKNENDKSIMIDIAPNDYDEKKHFFPNPKEVFSWGEKNEEGKPSKNILIKSLTEGQFINAIDKCKDKIKNVPVKITGNIKFAPNQDFNKLETTMSINSIQFVEVTEERPFKEGFMIQTPLILPVESLNDAVTEIIKCKNKGEDLNAVETTAYVPVYHKYDKPKIINSKEVKGRSVYVPYTITVDNKTFLNLGETSLGLDKKIDIFTKSLKNISDSTEFYSTAMILNYKSGVTQRTVDMEDLIEDPTFGDEYIVWKNMEDGEEKNKFSNDIINTYKAMYPESVRGEYKQCIELVSVLADRKLKANNVLGIDRESFEVYSLAKLKEESGVKTTTSKTTTEKPVEKKIETVKPSNIEEPSGGIGADFDEEDFPF